MAVGVNFSLPWRLLKRFGWQPLIEADFSRGISSDLPITSIPPGGVFEAVDYNLHEPGIAIRRGGTVFQSTATATSTPITALAAPTFPTGLRVLAIDGFRLYDQTGSSSVTVGLLPAGVTAENPPLYLDKLVITRGPSNNVQKAYVTGGAVAFADWGGSPPTANFSTVYAGRVVLGNTTANPNRIWFSPIPNPESTWDTTNAYIDTNFPITGLAVIQGVLLIFSEGHIERITGTVPPGDVGENMSLQTIAAVGCHDARSIAPWQTFLIFAGSEGVYITNGAGVDSLTTKPDGSGIGTLYRTYFTAADRSISTAWANPICGGVFARNFYHLALSNIGGAVQHLVCYLPRKTWWRVSNLEAGPFASALTTAGEELYMAPSQVGGSGLAHRVHKLSGMYVGAATSADADGTAILPILQTRMMGQGVGLKSYGDGHLHYQMPDGGSHPTMAIRIFTGVSQSVQFVPPESPLPDASAGEIRKRFTIAKDSQAISVRVTQQNASGGTLLYAVEAEQRQYSQGNEGQ